MCGRIKYFIWKSNRRKENQWWKREKHCQEEVRQWCLETFAETCKRNLEENPASSTSSLKKRSHSTEGDVVTYLKEMKSQKECETELKEKQIENISKAQQDLTNLQ